MAKARPQLDKMANGKKKPMSRTSGVARRLLGRSEGIATKLKYGAPLTGSASGVKSISLKDAGEVLTQGIVTLGKKGLKFAPEGLAMALPVGKVAKAGGLLLGKGKIFTATTLAKRLTAKDYGRAAAKEIARNAKTPNMAQQAAQDSYERVVDLTRSGRSARIKSQSVFPRTIDSAIKSPTLRQEYKTVKQGYEQVFGKGKKVSSFNPDIAAMTMRPGSGGSAAKIRKISNQVDAYLKKRGGKTIGK